MKTSFKLTSAIIGCALVFLLSGCSSEKQHPGFLTKHDWVHYTYCDETMDFGEDGSYSYYCTSGKPVDGYHQYDSYEYDEDTAEITLFPKADDSTIQVLRYEKSRLLLGFKDGVKEFFDQRDPLASNVRPDFDYDPYNYTRGFSSYLTILEKNGSALTTAPAGYDADDPYYSNYLLKEKLDTDAEFYRWDLKITAADTGEQTDSIYEELSAAQVQKMLDGGPGVGYVWYGSDMEIEKIVFYGKTVIQ